MEKCKWVHFIRFFLYVDFLTLCKCNLLSPTYAKVFCLYKCLVSSFLITLPSLAHKNMSLSIEKHPQKKWCPKIIINNKRIFFYFLWHKTFQCFIINFIPNFIRNLYILLLNSLGIFKIIVNKGSCHGHRIYKSF